MSGCTPCKSCDLKMTFPETKGISYLKHIKCYKGVIVFVQGEFRFQNMQQQK